MPERQLDRLNRQTIIVSRILAFVGLIGLLAIALATLVDVLSRWLLSAPIDGMTEISRLAVAVIMGAAFNPIIKSLVDDIIMPPIGLLLLQRFHHALLVAVRDRDDAAWRW